jgi:hypothetical protein
VQIWSQVTQIEQDCDLIRSPYDSIFQYTGSSLRSVSLSNQFDYPLILRHLIDHCPNLESLSIPSNLLNMFPAITRRLAALLPRLTRFCVPDGVVVHLYDVFDMCDSPLNITELILSFWRCSELGIYFERILSKIPRLRRLRACIPSRFVDLVLTLPRLECLEGIEVPEPFEDEEAALEFLRPFGASKIGGNLTVSLHGAKLSLVGLLIESNIATLRIPVILKTAGINSKISVLDALDALLQLYKTPQEFDAFLNLIGSNNKPPLQDPHPASDVAVAAPLLPDSSIKLFKSTFVSAKVAPSLVTTILLDPDRRQLLFDLGLVTVDDLTHPTRSKNNLFFHIASLWSLEWLLSIMSKDDAARLLREPAPGVEGGCLIFRFLPHPPFVSVIAESLAGLPIFSFPRPEELLLALSKGFSSVDTLKHIVDSNDIRILPRETRGDLLWSMMCTNFCFNPGIFDYWMGILQSPAFTDKPNLFASKPKIVQALSAEFGSLPRARMLHTLFCRYETDLVDQASKLPLEQASNLFDVFSALADWILRNHLAIEDERQDSPGEGHAIIFSSTHLEFVILNIFTPLARVCSNRKGRPATR